MAKLFSDYIPDEGYRAYMRLLELTRGLGHPVTAEEAKKAREKDSSFPAIGDFLSWTQFNDFYDAARKAFRQYERELPEVEEPEVEEEVTPPESASTESETPPEETPPEDVPSVEDTPTEDALPEDTSPEDALPEDTSPEDDTPPVEIPTEEIPSYEAECDPFDEGADPAPLYPVNPPKVNLINLLSDCLIRIVDPRYPGDFFYAENSDFYAEASEPDEQMTDVAYLIDSPVEGDPPNVFKVARPVSPIKLEIVRSEDESIRIPFPGSRRDILYLVSKSFAEAARAAGRSTDDLVFVMDGDFERVEGSKYNEIIVEKLYGL